MADLPFFSVVIPLHNKGPHIQRALRSVLDQSFQDFEILVVDDASSDDGAELAAKSADSRLRMLRRDIPGPGGYAARNLGVREARGTWIAFLDADDSWRPGHLAAYRGLIERYPDASFLGCGWFMAEAGKDPIGDPYWRRSAQKGDHLIPLRRYLELVLSGTRPVHTSIACVRNDSFVRAGIFPETRKARRGGDLHAWIAMMCRYRNLAWSAHVGGDYFLDAVNMVTKSAPSSPDLMERDVYRMLADGLGIEERRLMARYFNKRLANSWAANSARGAENFHLPGKLFWWAEPVRCAFYTFRTLLPPRTAAMLRRRLPRKKNR